MRHVKRHWSWIVLVGFLSSPTSAQTTPDIRQLEQGKPIERELAGGEVHAYSVQMTEGQFLSVIVDQRGIDVAVTLLGPDGKQIEAIDSPTGTTGPEPVSVLAKASGLYRIEVRSPDKQAHAGRYEVRIEALRDATPEDKKFGRIKDLAVTLANVKAEDEGIAALAKEPELITVELADALNVQGWTQQSAQAKVTYLLELRIAEQVGYRKGISRSLNNLAVASNGLGDLKQALEYLQRSLSLVDTNDKNAVAITLINIGWNKFLLGNYQEALNNYRQSLTVSEDSGNKALSASTLSSMSLAYRNAGDLGRALDCAQRALALNESLGNTRGVAAAHINIGLVYGNLSDGARALEHYRKSLVLSEELGAKGLIANALEKLAGANMHADYAQALEYAQRSLKLNEELQNYRGTIFSLQTIARIHQSHGDYAQALEYFQKALALSEKAGLKQQVVEALANISYSHLIEKKYSRSLEAAQRAIIISRQIGNRQLLLNALNNAAFSYLSLNQLENARDASEQAIALAESLRASVAGSESRAGYFSSARYPYDLNVDVLMQLHKQRPNEGYDTVAFQVSERARARSLLETLSESHADIRQGVDPGLLENERTLQQRLNATAERQTRLLSGKHNEDQAVRLQKELDAVTSEYQQVEAQIRQSSPRYAALTQPAPLTVHEIQSQVLDADTALLEYALGEDRSYLWVVTPTSVKSFELPKRAELETSVRRVVGMLSDGKQWATNAQISAQYAAAAAQLSRTLLPPALMSQLKVKRLVIVGDGALQYLPFGALPSPTSNVQSSKSRNGQNLTSDVQPLIADYEIVSLPSASTLAVLRRETANRARPTKSVAVLADPVFEATDERVQAAMAQGRQVGNGQPSAGTRDVSFDHSINSQALLRALDFKSKGDGNGAEPNQLKITRLPFTRFEAEGILKAAPPGQSLKATDFRANRETATSADLAQYRFVHFATHGILNSEHPELSGIVLSLVNERGQPADGFLRLNEIYNLNLSADLVVLSACQTGLGKEIRGEGLVGLTRGFMYAGAPRVVASLWKVDDAATAELMKRFYEGMLRDNLRPAAALRAAKVEMWKQKRWSAPFYWAAFELQGEWK
jgi:CHAT domain-containing protein